MYNLLTNLSIIIIVEYLNKSLQITCVSRNPCECGFVFLDKIINVNLLYLTHTRDNLNKVYLNY